MATIPPWLNIDPVAPVGRLLEGFRTGLQAGEAQTSAAQRAQQMMLAQQQAAQLNAYRQQQQALDEAQFNAKLRLEQDKAQREAQAAALQLEAQQGIQKDLDAGVPWPQTLTRWAPKLFAGEPRGMASAMQNIAPPMPPVFGKSPEGISYVQSPTGGTTLVPPQYKPGDKTAEPIFKTTPAGREYAIDPTTGKPIFYSQPHGDDGMTEAQKQMFKLRSLQTEFNQLSKAAMLAEDPAKVKKMTQAELEKNPEFKPVRKALDRMEQIVKERSEILGEAEGKSRPEGYTDQQLIDWANKSIAAKPDKAAEIKARLRAWGVGE